MSTYWLLVKTTREPGAGFVRATIQADNGFNAFALFKAIYGDLLISQFASSI